MKRLPRHIPLQRPIVAALAEEGRIQQATFVGATLAELNGLILIIDFENDDEIAKGILYKQDDMPRMFHTPEAVMGNAIKLGIKHYSIDTKDWNAEYYSPYQARARYGSELKAKKSNG